jgi:hypothetical protein
MHQEAGQEGWSVAMQFIRAILATAIFVGSGVFASVEAQQQQTTPRKRPVIINDPSLYRPPPLPRDRNYVGPGPAVAPPMQRIPQVAPLAQPPIR